MKFRVYVIWFVGALPLIIYPFAAIEAWGVLESSSYSAGPVIDARLANGVSVAALAYPLVYFLGVYLSRRRLRAAQFSSALKTGAAPLIYLAAFAALFAAWVRAEQKTIDAGKLRPRESLSESPEKK